LWCCSCSVHNKFYLLTADCLPYLFLHPIRTKIVTYAKQYDDVIEKQVLSSRDTGSDWERVSSAKRRNRIEHWCLICNIYTVSKSSPCYFADNFDKCKPIQIIIGNNLAEKIWNKLTMAISKYLFVTLTYASLVYIVK